LKDTGTFDTFAALLSGKKSVKKDELSTNGHQKRKRLSMKDWWQLVNQNKKLTRKLPRLKLK
jgi:putative sterol carrier protein